MTDRVPVAMVFPNLRVADVGRARAFFAQLGFGFDERFSDEATACLVLNDTTSVMLLSPERFASFLPGGRTAADHRSASEVYLGLLLTDRDAVVAMVEAALAAGGAPARPPEDLGFMYGWSFCDPDGHVWEPFTMDPSAVPPT